MPVRLATWSDLPQAATVLAAAFKDDDIFGRFVHPRREEYPADMYLYWLRFLREAHVTEPGEYLVISHGVGLESGQDAITGVAHWIRNYDDPPPTGWLSQMSLKAVETYNKAENLVWRNRAIDEANDAVLPRGNPFFMHHWSGSRADSWLLSLLGVDPQSSKQGFGRALVEWGFKKSLEESVPCSVISVPGQEHFYKNCGFDKVIGTTNDEGGDDNAWKAAGLEASPIMFCDHGAVPSGLKSYGEE
ncbi:hypothetical protein Q7P37_001657 [Cladosporium fusiforme]